MQKRRRRAHHYDLLVSSKKRTDTSDKHPLVFFLSDDSGQGIGLIRFLLHPIKSVAREPENPGLPTAFLTDERAVIFV